MRTYHKVYCDSRLRKCYADVSCDQCRRRRSRLWLLAISAAIIISLTIQGISTVNKARDRQQYEDEIAAQYEGRSPE